MVYSCIFCNIKSNAIDCYRYGIFVTASPWARKQWVENVASDLIFAVDSVSAIVAQVNDLFLACAGDESFGIHGISVIYHHISPRKC